MMAAAMDHDVEVPGRVEVHTEAREDVARTTVICGLRRRSDGPHRQVPRLRLVEWRSRPALKDQAAAAVSGARYTGWEGLLQAQREYLDELDSADAEAQGRPRQSAGRAFWAIPRLAGQCTRRTPGDRGKGLTGTGYDGHAFWDTEGYVLPLLTYTAPHAAADAAALAGVDAGYG